MHPQRTYLFTPGNHPRKVAKVFGTGADVVILDLEDAVAVAEKAATRETVVEALQPPRNCLGYVRVNALDTEFCYGDIQAVVRERTDGIMLPKVESPSQLETVDWLITQLEHERGLTPGAIDLLPIIETGAGVAAVEAIARAETRIKRISFGAGDYTRDMGMVWTPDEGELAHARACIVLASRVAGLEPPIDTVFIDLRDTEHLEQSARTALSMGFQGKLCIHPNQVEPVNRTFTPSEEEVARAEKFVVAFKEAEAAGSASIQVDGYFIDYPIVEKAERVLRIIESIRSKEAQSA
jgi:citrate lyase subunit beta/citryl-CoA lyase